MILKLKYILNMVYSNSSCKESLYYFIFIVYLVYKSINIKIYIY